MNRLVKLKYNIILFGNNNDNNNNNNNGNKVEAELRINCLTTICIKYYLNSIFY